MGTGKDDGSCTGNDSRCSASGHASCIRLASSGADCEWCSSLFSSGTSGKCVGKLAGEGADCKWRAAFSVTGSMRMAISNAQNFADNPEAKKAVKKGIANVTNVPPEYVDVDLHVEPQEKTRRLAVPSIVSQDAVLVTYAVSVPGDAPAAVVVTGADVSTTLRSANSGAIGDTISSKVDESFGSGVFAVSLQSVNAPDVAVAPSGTTSTSTVDPIGTMASSGTTSTSTVHPTGTVASLQSTQTTQGRQVSKTEATTSPQSTTSALPATASSTSTNSQLVTKTSTRTFLQVDTAENSGARGFSTSRQSLFVAACLAVTIPMLQ